MKSEPGSRRDRRLEQLNTPFEGLDARRAPEATAEPFTHLKGARLVTVLERRGPWAKVESQDGVVGWVDGQVLLHQGEDDVREEAQGQGPSLIKTFWLIVFGVAALGSAVLLVLASLLDQGSTCRLQGIVLRCESRMFITELNLMWVVLLGLAGLSMLFGGLVRLPEAIRQGRADRALARASGQRVWTWKRIAIWIGMALLVWLAVGIVISISTGR